jgi:hypothetical protein
VHDQATAHLEDGLDLDECVLSEGFAAFDEIDDLVGEVRNGTEFNGAPQGDDLGLDALGAIVPQGAVGILGSDPERHPTPQICATSGRLGHRHATASDPEIDGLVEVAAILLEGVESGDADVRDAVFDVGGDVGRFDQQDSTVDLIVALEIEQESSVTFAEYAIEVHPGGGE